MKLQVLIKIVTQQTWIELTSTNKLCSKQTCFLYVHHVIVHMKLGTCKTESNLNILTRDCKKSSWVIQTRLGRKEKETQQHVVARIIWIKSWVLDFGNRLDYIFYFSAKWKHEELLNLNNDNQIHTMYTIVNYSK
jgi:hypothetical protein